MLSHTQAKQIFERVAPDLTKAERLVAQAIALHETSYGAGWKDGHGAGSHNWGAIMRPAGDAGPFFETADSRPPEEAGGAAIGFVGRFKVYPSDDDGARDVVRVGLKPNVRAAAKAGDLQGVAEAMHANHYFTGTSFDREVNIARYRDALSEALKAIVGGTGESLPFVLAAARAPAPLSSPRSSRLVSLPVLRLGARGDAVELWRALLCTWRPELAKVQRPDDFDAALAEATHDYQQSHSGLVPDGVVGPRTWARMIYGAQPRDGARRAG